MAGDICQTLPRRLCGEVEPLRHERADAAGAAQRRGRHAPHIGEQCRSQQQGRTFVTFPAQVPTDLSVTPIRVSLQTC